jgi:hypothetical protein
LDEQGAGHGSRAKPPGEIDPEILRGKMAGLQILLLEIQSHSAMNDQGCPKRSAGAEFDRGRSAG